LSISDIVSNIFALLPSFLISPDTAAPGLLKNITLRSRSLAGASGAGSERITGSFKRSGCQFRLPNVSRELTLRMQASHEVALPRFGRLPVEHLLPRDIVIGRSIVSLPSRSCTEIAYPFVSSRGCCSSTSSTLRLFRPVTSCLVLLRFGAFLRFCVPA